MIINNIINFNKKDKILVLGASGWFGQTLLNLLNLLKLQGLDRNNQVLAIAGKTPGYHAWCYDLVKKFAPTIVLNFAFLTANKIKHLGLEQYITINKELTNRFLQALDLPSVHLGLTVSSGAAVTEHLGEIDLATNPYGYLKKTEEQLALHRISNTKSVIITRAYSVSGPYLNNPDLYAFSNMINQAISKKHIEIKSKNLVYRRYISIKDLLMVSIKNGLNGNSGIIEGGGNLIELLDLAQIIVNVIDKNITINRAEFFNNSPHVYASDNESWLKACNDILYEPDSIEQQIHDVYNFYIRK